MGKEEGVSSKHSISCICLHCLAIPENGCLLLEGAETNMEPIWTPPVSWSHPQPCLVLASQPLYDTKTCESEQMITLCHQRWG